MLALGLATLWGAIVVQGLLGRRRRAPVVAGLTAAVAITPFLPRVLSYLFDPDGFIRRYGTGAMDEVLVGGICVVLGLVALGTTPLAAKRAWGWLLPALSSLPPVALYVWLTFWFRIGF